MAFLTLRPRCVRRRGRPRRSAGAAATPDRRLVTIGGRVAYPAGVVSSPPQSAVKANQRTTSGGVSGVTGGRSDGWRRTRVGRGGGKNVTGVLMGVGSGGAGKGGSHGWRLPGNPVRYGECDNRHCGTVCGWRGRSTRPSRRPAARAVGSRRNLGHRPRPDWPLARPHAGLRIAGPPVLEVLPRRPPPPK